MRNPNGYGSVHKLSGKRRKPYAVQVTTGWDEEGRQIRKYLSYHTSKSEAMRALAKYNDNPYDLDNISVTFAEIYNRWSELKFKEIGRSGILGYQAAYKTCEPLYNIKFQDIKTSHLQGIVQNCGKKHQSLKKIKVLFNQLFEYAMKHDIVMKDYSNFVEIGKNKEVSTRKPFSAEEIQILWENSHLPYVDTILIMIYSGFRIGELLDIKLENIDLINRTITGGSKTEAGKNRLVPIHDKIFDFIKNRMEYNKSEYLICNSRNKKILYDLYKTKYFYGAMEKLSMCHKPHDCRHTFATLLNNAEANSTSIKNLIGHSNFLTTEKIYSHKDVEELRKAIKLIK
ncbi:tyrosine-type recombinase/integrase [Sebaldella sp. S0638]|uniref:tyrosine-type recombinase/integrase n=1 Tax=Sebaldella sp. S0638 TaxID=2957809 RepID=UPI0020A1A2CF|nr:tyrosine-type recombinase/integrase [Sebaldella sp. S0638]MCP1223894.1 tyrosine-type recombinase/integrase [Sebaldella sp. S0638]